ncbi:MAG: DNA-methyltransferase [Bacteroidales bacterium]
MNDNIQLYKGDCLQVMQELIDKGIKVDMVLTDPPYGTTRCKWDTVIPTQYMWNRLNAITKSNTAVLLFSQCPFDKILGASNIEKLRYEWIWEKSQATGHLNAQRMPMKSHENILVFYDNLPIYNPQKTAGHERKVSTAIHKRNTSTGDIYGKCDSFRDYDSTERYPRSVLKYSTDKQKNNLHPTQKPVALLEYLIKTYTNEGNIVLDFTIGSGSTGVACVNTGRKFIGIELDDKYFDIAQNRINEAVIEKKQKLF